MPSNADLLDALIDQCMARDVAALRERLIAIARRPDNDPAWGRLLDDINRSRELRERRLRRLPSVTYPPELPITQARPAILDALRRHPVIVLAGETGSGKTTQLPKMCLELGRGIAATIGHTQPRRIAARTVAARIADELGTPLGPDGAVGYKIRFADAAHDGTLIKLMTDGILLAETQSDPLLLQYDTLIIDEAHERSLNIDFLLGYLKRLLPRRPDLKLIITSATIDPQRFSRHFDDAPVLDVSGRTYPVEVRYRPITPDEPDLDEAGQPIAVAVDPIEAIADAVDEVRRESASGDILVFLATEREIRETAAVLAERLPDDIEVLPLYARLSADDQQRVFKPGRRRRVVLATNVAETSVTVPNIVYVIDPGEARISRYNPRTKVQRLPIEPISRASADQRKGRCGRVAPGVCIRLYSEDDYNARPAYTDPEIRRTNLASVVLQMIALHLGDIGQFPFIDPPDTRQIRDGFNTLYELGAVAPPEGVAPNAGDGRQYVLTELGRRLARIPADPRIGRMILAGLDEGVLDEVLVIAAALSVQDVRDRPLEHAAAADAAHARFVDEGSDFLTLLKIWQAFREKSRELSSSKLRKWCREHFLSYARLREWQETHRQLREIAAESLAERRGLYRLARRRLRATPPAETTRPPTPPAPTGHAAARANAAPVPATPEPTAARPRERARRRGRRGRRSAAPAPDAVSPNPPQTGRPGAASDTAAPSPAPAASPTRSAEPEPAPEPL